MIQEHMLKYCLWKCVYKEYKDGMYNIMGGSHTV